MASCQLPWGRWRKAWMSIFIIHEWRPTQGGGTVQKSMAPHPTHPHPTSAHFSRSWQGGTCLGWGHLFGTNVTHNFWKSRIRILFKFNSQLVKQRTITKKIWELKLVLNFNAWPHLTVISSVYLSYAIKVFKIHSHMASTFKSVDSVSS